MLTQASCCWRCGAVLDEKLSPFSRREECPACHADLHVCRMCVFFAPSQAKACREPIADEVKDKQRANFCGYFQANPRAWQPTPDHREQARSNLEALFGGASETAPVADARKKLDELFK